MSSKYTPLKFAALITPYFITVPIAIFLMSVLNVSAHDMGILAIQGVVLGLFYLVVAYLSNRRKITSLKFIILILVLSLPLATVMQSIVQITVRYDNVLIIIWIFTLAITVACTYEILRMLMSSKFHKAHVGMVK